VVGIGGALFLIVRVARALTPAEFVSGVLPGEQVSPQ